MFKKTVSIPRPKERKVIYNHYKELGVVRITPRKWLVVSCFVVDGLKSIRIHTRISIGTDPDMPDFLDRYKNSVTVTVNAPDGFAEENARDKLLALFNKAVDYTDVMPYEDNILYASDFKRPLAKDWYKD